MTFINYKGLHFRLRKEEIYFGGPKLTLEIQTNFNIDPKSGKTSSTYKKVDIPGFVSAVGLWVKRNQEFAGMHMDEFIDSLLTPDEINTLNGMPVATYTREEISNK